MDINVYSKSQGYMFYPWHLEGSSERYVELALLGIVHETDKAYLLRNSKGSFWVPKFLCGRVSQDRAEISGSFKIKLIKTGLKVK
tara:strand:- start:420 stop:674 length:255 start_codon:yes stop_codon:yes gene_type:complete